MPSAGSHILQDCAVFEPSIRLERFACGWYGVGHTAWRYPGDMRGTVVGKKGRFKACLCRGTGGDV